MGQKKSRLFVSNKSQSATLDRIIETLSNYIIFNVEVQFSKMTTDWAEQQKLADPYNFVKAEAFFQNLEQVASGSETASAVSHFSFEPQAELCSRQLILHFDNGKALSLRFVRPQVWRLRCNLNPDNLVSADYST